MMVSGEPSPQFNFKVSMMPKLVQVLSDIFTNSLLHNAVSLMTLNTVFGMAPFTVNTDVVESIQPFEIVVTTNFTLYLFAEV